MVEVLANLRRLRAIAICVLNEPSNETLQRAAQKRHRR